LASFGLSGFEVRRTAIERITIERITIERITIDQIIIEQIMIDWTDCGGSRSAAQSSGYGKIRNKAAFVTAGCTRVRE